MYLPKITNTQNKRQPSKVLPKLTKPIKSRELVETNNIPVSSERRLATKHRTKVKTKAPTTPSAVEEVVEVVDTLPTQTKSIDEVLEVKEEAIVEATPTTAEEVAEEVVEDTVEEATLDLEAMTKKELIAVAKQHKVSYKNLTKPELLEALSIVLG